MKTKHNRESAQRWVTQAGQCLIFFTLALGPVAAYGAAARLHLPTQPPLIISLTNVADGSAIQKALDQLPVSGGEVDLPAGTFIISQPIILQRDNQTLHGTGPDTILRLAPRADCPVIILGQPVNHPRQMVRHLRVSGLLIDGNRTYQSRERWRLSGEGSEIRNNGITIQHVSDSVVENVTCARCRSGGLVTTLDVRRLLVRHFTSFDNEFDGLACYETRHSIFRDLYLHDNPGAGISLDLAFNHNTISNALLQGNNLGVFMRASQDNQFFNVTIENSHHFGVFMAGHLGLDSPSACADNAFTNLTARDCGGPAFRVNNVTCTNNILIRAQFGRNPRGGLSLARPNLVTLE